MRTYLLLLPCALAAGCIFPQYKAEKTLEFTLPIAGLKKLHCESHNGDITITGDAKATMIALRADLSVRGHSQAEADANLHLLEVMREQVGDTLRIHGKYPAAELSNRSPGFRFTMTVPPELAVQLTSHNGDIAAVGMSGSAAIETHNGDVKGNLTTHHVVATTHNGDVELKLSGDGPLDGELRSHNGDIEVVVDERLGTRLEASTHNGKVTPPSRLEGPATVAKRRVTCKIGDGKGKLVIDTHNGDVVIR